MLKIILKKNMKLPFLYTIFLFTLTGCLSKPYQITDAERGKPYTVNGKQYYPLLATHGFDEVGKASWYGPGFHGKKTASGETFNMNAMTAAHKELPLGAHVFVQNLKTGKTIKVKINDRGPFSEDRVIDLSKKAAQELGMMSEGVATVRVTSSEKEIIKLERHQEVINLIQNMYEHLNK